jgi:protein disulfide-isomerase-like protein
MFIFGLCCSLALGQVQSVVVELDDSNFSETVRKNYVMLVHFYTTNENQITIDMTPELDAAHEFLEAASNLKGMVSLAKVDCDTNKKMAAMYGVKSFPSHLIISGEDAFEYEGPADASGMTQYLKHWRPAKDDVLYLNETNFDSALKQHSLALVKFYAPWCSACKMMKVVFKRAARVLKLNKIQLAAVDATETPLLAQRYGVEGYPTLKIFRRGKIFDYDGPRDISLVQHMQLQKTSNSHELKSSDDVAAFLNVEARFALDSYQKPKKQANKKADRERARFTASAVKVYVLAVCAKKSALFRAYKGALDTMRTEVTQNRFIFAHTHKNVHSTLQRLLGEDIDPTAGTGKNGIVIVLRPHGLRSAVGSVSSAVETNSYATFDAKQLKVATPPKATGGAHGASVMHNFLAQHEVSLLSQMQMETARAIFGEVRPILVLYMEIDWAVQQGTKVRVVLRVYGCVDEAVH